MADRVLAILRMVTNWFALGSDDYLSPIVRGMAFTKQSDRARKRILFDDEIRAVWKVSGESNDPFAALVRFLLLTAARRTEASALTWTEVKDGVWTLPASRNKVGKKEGDLVRPLSRAAMAVLEARPKIEGCAFVFTYDGRRSIAGYSKLKRRFDEAVLAELRKHNPEAELPNYVLHDLRRTARSLMSRADVQPHHAERCLGHVIGGVQGVYDRHKYQAEMARAYDALAAQIERIVNPPSADNVVALPSRG
jgi:integrase